jgi:hypothetical protein
MIIDKRFGDVLWDVLTGGKYYILSSYAVAEINNPYKVINKFETPEYVQLLHIVRKWYEDGIVDQDILAGQNNETTKTFELMKANRKPLEFNNYFGAVSGGYIEALHQLYPEQEFGWFDIQFDMYPQTIFLPIVSVDTSSLISIGSNSKYPEVALRFLEKAHTDPVYYNLLQYGVEGENYMLVDGTISYDGILDQNRKSGWTGLADGYMNLPVKYPDYWQPYVDKLYNKEGPALAMRNGISPYEGFQFDTTPVQSILDSMDSAKSQYIQPIAAGVSTDIAGDLSAAQEKLKDAGIDDYLSVLQKQLDIFAATR